ncbi:MAG: (d)CMP kinase [Bacteroidetes bacterium]|nr:(d)CMP kinase [Bacteroidota bacterium]
MIVTIDGPAGSGKSTAARLSAGRLGFGYLDSGALYRIAALKWLQLTAGETRASTDPPAGTAESRARLLDKLAVALDIGLFVDREGSLRYLLDGEDVSGKIRDERVGNAASVVSAHAPIRERITEIQRRFVARLQHAGESEDDVRKHEGDISKREGDVEIDTGAREDDVGNAIIASHDIASRDTTSRDTTSRDITSRDDQNRRPRGVVVEGRDIGTVVFPDADLKFFLDASPQIRAQRRAEELRRRGEEADVDEIYERILERDRRDRTRVVAPLIAAGDAIVLDSSSRSIEEIVGDIVTRVEDRMSSSGHD